MNRMSCISMFAAAIWASSVVAAPDNASTHNSRPPAAQAIGKTTLQKLPDLAAHGYAVKVPMFVVKNVGSGPAAASLLQIECRAQSTNAPCVPDSHYANLPSQTAPSPPAGMHMTAPHVWRVPVSALAPASEMKFALGVLPTAGGAAGLKFRVCADVGSTVAESSEANNCAEFVFKKLD
jgi:hypothetical protein